MYYIFSFRSRNQSICFFECAAKAGVSAKLINTPRVISIGCGLSVKVAAAHIDAAYKILNTKRYTTFLGLFYYNGSKVVRVEDK